MILKASRSISGGLVPQRVGGSGLLFNGDRASVWADDNIVELDSDGCMTL